MREKIGLRVPSFLFQADIGRSPGSTAEVDTPAADPAAIERQELLNKIYLAAKAATLDRQSRYD